MKSSALPGIVTLIGLCSLSLCHTRQYHVVYDQMNWTDAQQYCRDKFTDLATIGSLEDLKTLNDTLDLHSLGNHGAWIGLYDDINSWRWLLVDQQEQKFWNWAPGQPDNWDGKECCTDMYPDGTWNDVDCAVRVCAICFDDREPIEKYIFINESLTRDEAQTHCRERHTDLASVRNQAENDKIREKIPSNKKCWIGLYRDCWKWSDGSSYSFRDWNTGEPTAGIKENCVYLPFDKGLKWEDGNCDVTKAFICNSNEVSMKKVRIEVTRRNSSLDLNNPDVKEAMLEQFKQSLKDEGGTADIKLKWVEQSDGKVFHKEDKKKRKKKRQRKPVLTKMEL